MTPLTLYVDPAWKRSTTDHTALLYPHWGKPEHSSLFSREMWGTYSYDTSVYRITDRIEKAEMVLAPYRHNWLLSYDQSLFAECQAAAKKARLPLLVDGTGDVEHLISDPNIFVLRYSGYRFLSEPGRIQIPLAVDDLLERCEGGIARPKEKSQGAPIVGFSGWASVSLRTRLNTLRKEWHLYLWKYVDERRAAMTKGIGWRKRALSILARSPAVIPNFRVRSSFSANPKTAGGDLHILQREMVDTILGSDYALDVRGDANNSARLFEILSLGRIPVIIDTERIFPFLDEVDYSSFALIVDFRDIERLSEIIADFHARITPEQFLEMQQKARAAFVEYFRIDAIMRHVVRAVRTRLPHTP